MIFPDYPVDVWARRYGIEVYHTYCPVCKSYLELEYPFATKKMRGITSRMCKCGQQQLSVAVLVGFPNSKSASTRYVWAPFITFWDGLHRGNVLS